MLERTLGASCFGRLLPGGRRSDFWSFCYTRSRSFFLLSFGFHLSENGLILYSKIVLLYTRGRFCLLKGKKMCSLLGLPESVRVV